MKKIKKRVAILSTLFLLSYNNTQIVQAVPDLTVMEGVLRTDAVPVTPTTKEKITTTPIFTTVAGQLINGYLLAQGIDPTGINTNSLDQKEILTKLIMSAIFEEKNTIPSQAQGVIENIINGFGSDAGGEIIANASTVGDILSQADVLGQQIGLANGGLATFGQAASAGPSGIIGLATVGAGDALGGALGGGTSGAGGLLGTGGRTISDNAQYSVQINGPQVIDGLVVLDPPNPLKGKAITFIATAIAKPPAGGQVIIDLPVITDSVTYDQAGYYEKQFVFPYTYIPPRVGDNQPAPIKGTMLMTTKFRVSEFNAMSTGGAGTGNYGDTGGSVGGSNISGPTLVNTGGGNSSANLLGQTPITQLTQAAPPSPGFSNALTSVLTGDIPLPFGSLTNGASSPNINIDMNGVGNGLMSVSNMVYNLLKDKDAPKNTNGVRDPAVESGNIQSDKTPDQVRKENFQDMTSILKTATQLVAAKGVTDINKLYDPDSAYTSPNEAWDMNRLTRFQIVK